MDEVIEAESEKGIPLFILIILIPVINYRYLFQFHNLTAEPNFPLSQRGQRFSAGGFRPEPRWPSQINQCQRIQNSGSDFQDWVYCLTLPSASDSESVKSPAAEALSHACRRAFVPKVGKGEIRLRRQIMKLEKITIIDNWN